MPQVIHYGSLKSRNFSNLIFQESIFIQFWRNAFQYQNNLCLYVIQADQVWSYEGYYAKKIHECCNADIFMCFCTRKRWKDIPALCKTSGTYLKKEFQESNNNYIVSKIKTSLFPT